MKKSAFKRIEDFKKFVYESGEGHFFFFCDIHRGLLERAVDGAGPTAEDESCDWPTCKLKATTEFFPNLVTALKKYPR